MTERAPSSWQVVGAKVVTNARSPGARCYGFVTMSTAEEATKCISHLHRTELHGRMISVEKVRPRAAVEACGVDKAQALVAILALPILHFRPKTNLRGRSCPTGESAR